MNQLAAKEPVHVSPIADLIPALLSDHDYAWSWHCNIAMAATDEGVNHMVANRGAARFLQLLTGGKLDTRTFVEYKGIVDRYAELAAKPVVPEAYTDETLNHVYVSVTSFGEDESAITMGEQLRHELTRLGYRTAINHPDGQPENTSAGSTSDTVVTITTHTDSGPATPE